MHYGNIKQYNIMIMTAEFSDFQTYSKLMKYYFYISTGDLGTTMGYTSEVK